MFGNIASQPVACTRAHIIEAPNDEFVFSCENSSRLHKNQCGIKFTWNMMRWLFRLRVISDFCVVLKVFLVNSGNSLVFQTSELFCEI